MLLVSTMFIKVFFITNTLELLYNVISNLTY
jgi:hypothetical protein